MKKVLIVVLVLVLVIGVSQIVFKQKNDSQLENEIYSSTKVYGYNGAVEYLQKKHDLSYEEAIEILGPESTNDSSIY